MKYEKYECYDTHHNKYVILYEGNESDFVENILFNENKFFLDENGYKVKSNQIVKFKKIGE